MIPMHVHVLQDLMELCVVQVWKSIVTHVQCFLADFRIHEIRFCFKPH